jgi:hypothetical protein
MVVMQTLRQLRLTLEREMSPDEEYRLKTRFYAKMRWFETFKRVRYVPEFGAAQPTIPCSSPMKRKRV